MMLIFPKTKSANKSNMQLISITDTMQQTVPLWYNYILILELQFAGADFEKLIIVIMRIL